MAKFEKGHKQAKGRPKGSTNIATAELKDMILGALADAGGREYLKLQSLENPTAFMTLVGKVLPKDINAKVEGNLTFNLVNEF